MPFPASRHSGVCWDLSRVYRGRGQIDHGGEALVGLFGSHCDALEFLELTEEVLDGMSPLLHHCRWREAAGADVGR